ncbi:MAG: hypothetical protein Q4E51_00830 [Lachnospiraceae bacterium]|nr:hypothetical protein [Lachnospiraceae bacterium]
MKKFLIKSLAFALLLALVFAPVNIVVDPYNIFHWDAPRDNGVEPNKNFIKTKYVLNNKDKFDSFLFGSSRAGFMDVNYLSELTGDKWYDMASSEAVVAEHVNTLKVFIKHGLIPKNVFVMVDDISCFVDPKTHENMLYRVPYPTGGIISYMEFYAKYCDLITTFESIGVMKEHVSEDVNHVERYRNSGTERLDKATYFDPTLPQFQVGYWADYYSYRVDEAIEDMQDLVDLCNENNINLTVVTNPLYYLTYGRDLENGYIDYLNRLADVTEYYNFSSFSDITLEYTNYYETSHFTPEIGRKMIEVTQGMQSDDKLSDQGFGYYVTSDNRDEFIAMLLNQANNNNVVVKNN